jgi:hypothetical protein
VCGESPDGPNHHDVSPGISKPSEGKSMSFGSLTFKAHVRNPLVQGVQGVCPNKQEYCEEARYLMFCGVNQNLDQA